MALEVAKQSLHLFGVSGQSDGFCRLPVDDGAPGSGVQNGWDLLAAEIERHPQE